MVPAFGVEAAFLFGGTVKQTADCKADKHHRAKPHIDKGHGEGTENEA
ncbi:MULTISPECIES: hypothetical protein [Mucilaginibacter]|uniref:Uncharacterized protein n=1 Tax=Mucilaginibacter rubeus TaxID=2027860 RepID=A0ABX7UDV4_9SPHI|nr:MULTISPECIES: hypothetical protein [Mucilaginibacter]QTE43620.1 hypothetical protein J3L19_32665 [Mucilaginibacter rubeus]QTE50220.1 hypothetical protein J3L21_32620 [Mucilaginibacter rubeus]QTE55308.1 hypothetical protein J3L23_24240 [Mucilaginibacter rubeus]QTE65233.1 hypothetical protein J3L22_09585 [Mucilaginibacter rubeus]QTF63986.1 hypothetical protein J3L20_09260 [Mucilaginibacter rubeus]